MRYAVTEQELYAYLQRIREAENGERKLKRQPSSYPEDVWFANFTSGLFKSVRVFYYRGLINNEPVWNALHSYEVKISRQMVLNLCIAAAILIGGLWALL